MRDGAFQIVLAGLFAAGGVVGLLGAVVFWRQARRSRTWPTTSGVVEASRVAQAPGMRFTLPYQARVTFRYGVGGRFYVSNLRSLEDTGYRSRTDAQRVADRYPPGAGVTVYYNPSDPPVGVLEPGGGAWFAALSATIGVCCLAFGFVLWRA